MPDPFAHVRPGDPIKFGATAYNAMLDAAIAFQQGKFGNDTGGQNIGVSATIINIQNNTGNNLDRRAVLELADPIFLPDDSLDAFLEHVTFGGVVPGSEAGSGKFCITLEPALDGAIARAFIAGVCQVQIKVDDPDIGFADIEYGVTDYLLTNPGGAARILWLDTGPAFAYGDTVWGIVRFDGSGGQGESVRIEIPAGGIETDTSAACRYYRSDHNLSPEGDTLTVWNRGPVTVGAATAKMGFADWMRRENEFQAVNRFC